jgi:glycogen debranching enzyme
MMRRTVSFVLLLSASSLLCQPHAPVFNPIPAIAFDTSGPVIRAHTEALKPFTVAGERGVIVGQQDGAFEAWLLPAKILSHLTIEADVEGYTVPIDVNQQSAEIEVRPDRTTITYAHIAFTVRQIMFSPAGAPAGTGPVVLFEFDCLHPTDFTLRFTPELRWMWPERNEGVPGVEWVAPAPNAYERAGGLYVLHSDYPDFAAAVTIPGARPGILAPYQERPQVHPVELKLHIDPARDRGKLFPLLMAYGANISAANSANLAATLEKLGATIPDLYKSHAENWKKTLANSVTIDTPDKALNEAFQWAVISIEQLKTKTIPGQSAELASVSGAGQSAEAGSVSGHDLSRAENSPNNDGALAPEGTAPEETALVAGYYASADSARPGFGWFFGRDALYTLYAVNGYGDFSLSKSELEFLIHRQRADGKIMHEWSQTAAAIDWRSFPYMYAAADSTPLFLLATLDYVRASGDVAFLTAHREAIEKAWEFETSHAPDSAHGGNGIYENTQGTGWVESWPGGLPHQEIYLATLDQQASGAMAQIESLLGDKAKSDAAQARAAAVARTIEEQFYDKEKDCYAFSRNADGSLDHASTVYPALAWWSSPSVTKNAAYLAHPEGCLKQFAAHTLNTDWGLRDLSNEDKYYDGMSYHQGSVWPLFTGWAALAEYRGNQPLAGYQMLMENANLTWAQDLGADTELLSGDFFVPFGRSTSHQLWSSAMVITPTLRGLFGIDIDAQSKTITVNPHLPAGWNQARVEHIQVPGGEISLCFARDGDHLVVYIAAYRGDEWKVRSDLPGVTSGIEEDQHVAKRLGIRPDHGVRIPSPAVEIDDSLETFADRDSPPTPLMSKPPVPGARTNRFRIVRSEYGPGKLTLTMEGLAGTAGMVSLIRSGHIDPKVETTPPAPPGAGQEHASISHHECDAHPSTCKSLPLLLHFPEGEGWKTITVTLTW